MILRTLHNMTHSNIQSQRGGTLLGFVLGLVIGLVIALGVAMYVTKVPTPFSNKNQSRSADQDAVEAQKNKDWNPNAAIQSKPAAPEAPAEGTTTQSSASAPAVTADPLADMIKKQSPSAAPAASAPTAATSTPSTPSNAANDPFTYFVQAGAFKSANDADAQKAKLSMMGIEAKVSEREQAGRAIFRVRSGPFDDKEQAEKIKARLDANGMDAALVRVQR
jgi:cell division protein FtsN